MRSKSSGFSQIASIIMIIIFIMNLILSKNSNLLEIVLYGGGCITDYLALSYTTIFKDLQVYRLITYGYTHVTIWHLLANVFALYYVGRYIENRMSGMKFLIIYHITLVVAGIMIFIIYPNSYNYGASPAIFACFGILFHWIFRDRELWYEYKKQKGFYFLMCYFVFSNLLGISSFVIHFIGFCVGFMLSFSREDGEKWFI